MKNTYYVAVCAALVLLLNQSKAQKTTIAYQESSENFPNPERGLYMPHDPPPFTEPGKQLEISKLQADRANGMSLAGIRWMLADWQAQDNLPQSLLDQVSNDFAKARQAGVKIVGRFTYNWGNCWENGKIVDKDAPVDRVLKHIEQLAPVLNKNKDVLAYLEAGFIGCWGEWHSSYYNLIDANGLNSNTRSILDKLFAQLNTDRMVAVRRPLFKWQYIDKQPLTAGQAFKPTKKARLGEYNDCVFCGSNDGGTYAGATAEEFKTFLQQDNLYVVQGGEPGDCCAPSGEKPSDFDDCTKAQAEFKRMHWSAFNANQPFASRIYTRWKNEGCYNDIAKKLGYRFVLQNATIPNEVEAGKNLELSLQIKNIGWARLYNPRHIEIVLRSGSNVHRIRYQPSQDERLWLPGPDDGSITLTLSVPVPSDLAAGNYEVLLNLPDPMSSINTRPEYAIRLANQNTWEANTGYNKLLHTLKVKSVATGIVAKKNGESISIYPNPASEEIIIKYTSSHTETTEFIISDMLSRIVKKQVTQLRTGTNEIKVNVSDLEKGLYTIQFISSDKEIITKKLLINN